MKVERLVFKNTLTLGIGKTVGDITLFCFLIYFSRSFGQDALGQYAFAMSVGGLLTLLVSLGLNTYAIREISKDTRCGPEFVGQLFALRSICALLCLGLLWLIALVIDSLPETRQILLIIGTYHILQKLIGIFNVGFLAHEEMKCPTVLGILERMIILMAGSLGIYYSLTPVLTLTVYPVSASIILLASFLLFRIRYGKPVFRFHYPFIITAIRQASPFLVIMILAQFYDRIGLIILTLMKGEAVTGIFMAGDRFLSTINGFSAVFATALFPSISRLSMEKKEDLNRLTDWAFRMAFIFIFPLASMIYILSDQFILLAFGDKFGASAAMLRIACWSLVLFAFNRILSIVLIASYRQGELVRIRIIAYISYFFLSILLIWEFSYLGLAWSKIITETGVFLFTLSCAAKVSPSVSTLKRFIVPAALCLLFIVGFSFTGGGSLLAAALFAALFVTITVVFEVVHAEDLKLLKIWLIKKGQ